MTGALVKDPRIGE